MPYAIRLDVAELTGLVPGTVHLGLEGADTANGSGGDDIFYGGRGNDSLNGAAGRDLLAGGQGRDLVIGGAGDDFITGGGSFPTFGITGDDRNADTVQGGDGNDVVLAGLNDVADGGIGSDTLYIQWFNVPTAATTLDFSGISGAAAFATGVGTQTAANFERLELLAFDLFSGSSVRATSGDDLLEIGVTGQAVGGAVLPGANVNAGAGDDWISVTSLGNNTIAGGGGDDIILTGTGQDAINGGAGSDLVFTQLQISVPGLPNADADIINGFNAAEDLLVVNILDFVNPAPTYNTNLLVSGVNPVAQAAGLAQFLYDTGSGRLWFDLNGTTAGERYLIATFTGIPVIAADNLVVDSGMGLAPFSGSALAAGFGFPSVLPSVGQVYQAAGTGGNDVIVSGAVENRLFGNAGNDSITGGNGSDILYGNTGKDTVRGAGGDDEVNGGAGADLLFGDAGNDFLAANDLAFGSYGDADIDTVDGGAGNDYVVIGQGDVARGGTGSDVLVIEDLSFTGGPILRTLDFTRVQGAALQTFGLGTTKGSGFESVIFFGQLAAGSSVTGTSGDDEISVGGSFGAGPGSTIQGGAGDDSIDSSGGNDTVYGGAGEDVITISDADRLYGGTEADAFLFNPSFSTGGLAQIMDFDATDVIVVSLDTPFFIGATQFNTAPLMNPAARLISGAAPVAAAPGLAQFLFNTTTNTLSLDVNGSSAGGIVNIARFAGTSLPPVASQLAVEIAFDLF